MHFYTFPGSCAVQVMAGLGYGPHDMGSKLPDGALTQKHILTLAVMADSQERRIPELKRLGFRRLGEFNAAHSAEKRLTLWIAGGEFELNKHFLEHKAPEKEQ